MHFNCYSLKYAYFYRSTFIYLRLIEKDAIKSLQKGSAEGFEFLYNLYHGKLYNYILKLTNGNADSSAEIVQCVFIKLWDMRATIDEEKNLFNFLYTIAKNTLLNNYSHLLIKEAYNTYILELEQPDTHFTELEVDRNLLDQLIAELTNQLPPVRKKIFIMSRREGKSHKEIAQQLSISEKTVEHQIGKALSFLRVCLQKYYGNDFFYK